MPEANGMILAKEEENDAEVRREDQDQINEFGRLNARLHEVRDEVGKLKVSILLVLFGMYIYNHDYILRSFIIFNSTYVFSTSTLMAALLQYLSCNNNIII